MSVTPINSKLFKAVSASTTAIAIAQTLGGAGNLNLTSSSVSDGSNMDTTVTLTSTGNISGVTFTVTGTDASGSTITEDVRYLQSSGRFYCYFRYCRNYFCRRH